jgi:hypothetical protein
VSTEPNGPAITTHAALAEAYELDCDARFYLLTNGHKSGLWAFHTSARALEMLQLDIGAPLWPSWTLRDGDRSTILFSCEPSDPHLITDAAIFCHRCELVSSVELPDSRNNIKWHTNYRSGMMALQPLPLPFLQGLPKHKLALAAKRTTVTLSRRPARNHPYLAAKRRKQRSERSKQTKSTAAV